MQSSCWEYNKGYPVKRNYPNQWSDHNCFIISIISVFINNYCICTKLSDGSWSKDFEKIIIKETAKDIFDLLNNQKKSNRLIIFATHNRFFANKADCLLELTDGSIKSFNA